jgi:hypothetical protein
MSSCANCAADAIYTYQINDSFAMHYCQSHLPRFLYDQRDAGNLAFKSAEESVEEASKSSKKKSTPVVDEEPVVEEVPVGE